MQIDEIAVAYGPRAVAKLVEVLSLPDLPTSSVAKALRVLLSLLSSQVSSCCDKLPGFPNLLQLPANLYLHQPCAHAEVKTYSVAGNQDKGCQSQGGALCGTFSSSGRH